MFWSEISLLRNIFDFLSLHCMANGMNWEGLLSMHIWELEEWKIQTAPINVTQYSFGDVNYI